ncbi:hypothetical protein PLICRDRAFT_48405 [Plicaturopsis crispa FD-325 SS-3]|nr:hypothetical protein PLICRDRAFT_48405 [Plicaturopsis crispa FD-325 SS-3]
MPPKSQSRTPRTGATETGKFSNTKTGRKTAVKRPLSDSERLKRLFTSLCAQIDGGHFGNAIKTCEKILVIDPRDTDALQTKLFLLLQTDQYETALTMVSAGAQGSAHAFERAYSLYRLHRESEATDVLRSIKDSEADSGNRGVQHLEAQLNYRGGSYQTAFDVYNQLLDSAEPQTEEHSDILTNLQASQRQLDFVNKDYLRALDALPTKLSSSLESAPPPTQPSSSLAAALASSAATGPHAQHELSSKAKKVRMSRVPAGVTPGVTPLPDPERWLKKSERSTFGQGGRRKKGGGGGATQGSTSEGTPTAKPSGGSKGKKKK